MGGGEGYFGERVAARYDDSSWGMFDPAVIGPTVALLAGLRLADRWGGWGREPFTGLSPAHVSVYEKP